MLLCLGQAMERSFCANTTPAGSCRPSADSRAQGKCHHHVQQPARQQMVAPCRPQSTQGMSWHSRHTASTSRSSSGGRPSPARRSMARCSPSTLLL